MRYIKFPRDLRGSITVGTDGESSRLSQCYDKVNTVVDYSAVEVYLHAFSATALDGDVQLTSTSVG